MKKIFILSIIIVFLTGIIILVFKINTLPIRPVNSFEECANSGFTIMETYPRRCRTPDKQVFVEEIDKQSDSIIIGNPKSGEIVSSPLLVTGKAIGKWFFEASFPIKIIDATGRVLGESVAQTSEEWMTTDFVSFNSKLEFSMSNTKTGVLIFSKNNPSGLPEHDEEFRIPILFKDVSGSGN